MKQFVITGENACYKLLVTACLLMGGWIGAAYLWKNELGLNDALIQFMGLVLLFILIITFWRWWLQKTS